MIFAREQVVDAARAWIGTPYRHQASVIGAGCDCLGLIRGVWRTLYGDEPMGMPAYRADLRDEAHAGTLLEAAERFLVRADDELRAGQVALFQLRRAMAPKHCGVMVAADRFVHAQEGLGVVEAALSEGWRRRMAGRFEFP